MAVILQATDYSSVPRALEINEKGTEAAAATGVTIKMTALQEPRALIKIFNADHSFIVNIGESIG